MKNTRTEISSLGEFGLINRIRSKFMLSQPSSIAGIGEDAAVIDTGSLYTLISSDMMVEKVDFDLAYFPLQHLGYKLVVINVSDIVAMNGKPRQILTNIGLSNRISVEAVDALYDGIKKACDFYQIDLVGGDVTASPSGLILSVTITGVVEKNRLVRRSLANLNDIICVTGELGASYMGLTILQREKETYLSDPGMQPDLHPYEHVVHKHLMPDARTDVIEALSREGVFPTSMIDISDGLASDLLHICHESQKGAVIYENKLPFHPKTAEVAKEFDINLITVLMNGGEDFELLFTVRPEDYEKIQKIKDIHPVGYIKDISDGANLFTTNGNMTPIKAQGWDHLKIN